jgi:hypothetical protein
VWTPQGYYTGSPGADKFVGWQIKKPDQVSDYVGADQLRDHHLNRPDTVEKGIMLAYAEAAVRESLGTTFKLADLLALPASRFKIMEPLTDERGGRAIGEGALDKRGTLYVLAIGVDKYLRLGLVMAVSPTTLASSAA